MGGKRNAGRHTTGAKAGGFRVVPDVAADAGSGAGAARRATGANTTIAGERASSAGVVLFSAVLFALCFCIVLGAAQIATGSIGVMAVVVALVVALLAVSSVHIAQQWEKVVVLRLGKFNRVSGPGLFWTIPVIEQNTMRVDGRVRVTSFGAEGSDPYGRPGAPRRERRAVLARVGCQGGLHGGGRLHARRGAGGADRAARRHRARRRGGRWRSAASSLTAS